MAAVPITVPGRRRVDHRGHHCPLAQVRRGGCSRRASRCSSSRPTRPATSSPRRPPGVLKIEVPEGTTVAIGASVGTIDPGGRQPQAEAAAPRSPRRTADGAAPPPRARRRAALVARRPPHRRRGAGRSRVDRAGPAGAAGSPRGTSSPTCDRAGGRTAEPGQPLGSRRPARLVRTAARSPHQLRRAGPAARDPPADERHPPEDRPAPGRGAAHRRDPDDLQRGRHDAGHGAARPVQGHVQDEARRGPRLHVVLHQGGGRGAQGVPGGQRPDRRRGHRATTTPTISASPSAPSAG